MPVPAVKGGAIEQLIQYFIEGNEVNHEYDIDLYTVDDPLLIHVKYKYTTLIKLRDKQKNIFGYRLKYGLKNRFNKVLHNQTMSSYLIDSTYKRYKRNYYDVVLVENNMDLYQKIYPIFNKERIVFHLHNDVDCNDPAKTKEKTKYVMDTADKIIVVSDFLKQKLVKIAPEQENKVYVAYNGIIGASFKNIGKEEKIKIREKYNLQDDDIVFTFVGRMCSDKGIDKLLKAMGRLKKYPKIHCLIVGNNFFGSAEENDFINNLNTIAKDLTDKIHFTGYISNSELYKIYSITDCVIIPAQYEEVFGVVALEAMKMQKPVIASISGALPEVLSEKCAIFIKRDTKFVLNLSDTIYKLANDKSLRIKLGLNGGKRSMHFPQNEKQYFNLIRNIIGD